MPSAYLDAGQIRFPPACPHCGQPAETTRRITAHGPLDVLVGEYARSLSISIPVCLAAARTRKWFGAAVVAGEVLLVLLGGFLAVAVSMAGHNTASAVVVIAAIGVALPLRGGWDAMMSDWHVIGVRAWRPFGQGGRVRLSFKRDQYFSEWASINPSAFAGGALGWRPPVPLSGAEADGEIDAAFFSRTLPAIVLAFTVPMIALHHWYAVNGGHVFLAPLCVLTGAAFLSIGGLVYPPVFWAISKEGRQLPLPLKIVGWCLGLAGLVSGFLLGISYSHWPR
jgi:hypothetical protein